jgi:RNA polymerase sigma-70 factor (ECF subfamily)
VKENTEYIIDKTVLADIAGGNEEAFEKFVHGLYKKLFPLTVSLIKSASEADDILQEVLLKIWLHRSSLTTLENPFGWICKVMANTASNHLRSRIRRELNMHRFNDQAAAAEEIEGEIDAKFTQSLIDEAVSLLPPKRKLVFLLSKKEGLSRREIAERLNISEHTVRNQLAEAIHSVSEHLGHKGDTIFSLLILLHFSCNFFD